MTPHQIEVAIIKIIRDVGELEYPGDPEHPNLMQVNVNELEAILTRNLAALTSAPVAGELTDEQIDEIGEPFGYFKYGDAQGDKRYSFARAILAASHTAADRGAVDVVNAEVCTLRNTENPRGKLGSEGAP